MKRVAKGELDTPSAESLSGGPESPPSSIGAILAPQDQARGNLSENDASDGGEEQPEDKAEGGTQSHFLSMPDLAFFIEKMPAARTRMLARQELDYEFYDHSQWLIMCAQKGANVSLSRLFEVEDLTVLPVLDRASPVTFLLPDITNDNVSVVDFIMAAADEFDFVNFQGSSDQFQQVFGGSGELNLHAKVVGFSRLDFTGSVTEISGSGTALVMADCIVPQCCISVATLIAHHCDIGSIHAQSIALAKCEIGPCGQEYCEDIHWYITVPAGGSAVLNSCTFIFDSMDHSYHHALKLQAPGELGQSLAMLDDNFFTMMAGGDTEQAQQMKALLNIKLAEESTLPAAQVDMIDCFPNLDLWSVLEPPPCVTSCKFWSSENGNAQCAGSCKEQDIAVEKSLAKSILKTVAANPFISKEECDQVRANIHSFDISPDDEETDGDSYGYQGHDESDFTSETMHAVARNDLAKSISGMRGSWTKGVMPLLLILNRYGYSSFPNELIRLIMLHTEPPALDVSQLHVLSASAEWYELRDWECETAFITDSWYCKFEYRFHDRMRSSFTERFTVITCSINGGAAAPLFEYSDAETNQLFHRKVSEDVLVALQTLLFGQNASISLLKMAEIALIISGGALHPDHADTRWIMGTALRLFPELEHGETLLFTDYMRGPVEEFQDHRREDSDGEGGPGAGPGPGCEHQ